MTEIKTERSWYLDYMRIIATLAVIMIHVSSYRFQAVEVTSTEWAAMNFYDSIARYAVPVFLMLSGALFLQEDKKIDVKLLYGKYIFRIVTAFIFWSVIYAVYIHYNKGWQKMLTRFIEGYTHMWYLFLIVGLYMIVPFLKQIIASKELTKYFLLLGFVFTFLIPEILYWMQNSPNEVCSVIGKAANNALKDMDFRFAAGLVFYFVGGAYLNQITLNKKTRTFIYIAGILGFLATIVITYVLTLEKGKPVTTYYGHLKINVLLESIFVFVFCKYELSKFKLGKVMQTVIIALSKYSFGVYLVHMLVRNVLAKNFGLYSLTFHPILAIPVVTFVIVVISFLISMILNHIPVVRRFLV